MISLYSYLIFGKARVNAIKAMHQPSIITKFWTPIMNTLQGKDAVYLNSSLKYMINA